MVMEKRCRVVGVIKVCQLAAGYEVSLITGKYDNSESEWQPLGLLSLVKLSYNGRYKLTTVRVLLLLLLKKDR